MDNKFIYKKNQSLVLYLIICLLYIINFSNLSANQDNKQSNKINQQISTIKNKINEENINLNKYNIDIKNLTIEINKKDAAILKLKKNIIDINKEQKKLNLELNQLIFNIKNNKQIIKEYLIVMHKLNNYPKLKLLLSNDITNWGLLRNYLKILNDYEKEKFDLIKKQIQSINSIDSQIESTKAEHYNKNQELENFKQKLITLKTQKINLKSNIEKDIFNSQKKLSDLLKIINNQNINKQNKITNKNFKQLQQNLIMPIKGEIITSLANDIQNRLIQNGIFIKTKNKYIYAIYDGKIVFADWLKLYGNVVIIDHQNGYMSLYANNKKVLPKVGTFIQAGEQIAVIGNSGEFGQQGSYFELRYKGKPLNPIKWLKIG